MVCGRTSEQCAFSRFLLWPAGGGRCHADHDAYATRCIDVWHRVANRGVAFDVGAEYRRCGEDLVGTDSCHALLWGDFVRAWSLAALLLGIHARMKHGSARGFAGAVSR